MPSQFTLESVVNLSLATGDSKIKTFRYQETNFRLVFVDLPGPLVSASIVIPTICTDDKGLPHTLEVKEINSSI